jgi:endonuclease-3
MAKPPPSQTKRMTHEAAARFFAILAASRPDPATELQYLNPYTLLVAVVLSAQATDVSVNKATEPLFKLADTPQKMVDLGEARVRDFIKTIGLYRTKAKNVIALSTLLLEKHHGQVPGSREALEELPGVGRKTANVVLNVAFGRETIAVDTHIFRVSNRTGLAPGKDPLEVELGLEKIVPAQFKRHAHHWLILHGRYVCVARNPKCPECPVRALCLYPEKTKPEGVKNPANRPSSKARASASPSTRPRSARRARTPGAKSRGG